MWRAHEIQDIDWFKFSPRHWSFHRLKCILLPREVDILAHFGKIIMKALITCPSPNALHLTPCLMGRVRVTSWRARKLYFQYATPPLLLASIPQSRVDHATPDQGVTSRPTTDCTQNWNTSNGKKIIRFKVVLAVSIKEWMQIFLSSNLKFSFNTCYSVHHHLNTII